jgi:hypothetical protein
MATSPRSVLGQVSRPNAWVSSRVITWMDIRRKLTGQRAVRSTSAHRAWITMSAGTGKGQLVDDHKAAGVALEVHTGHEAHEPGQHAVGVGLELGAKLPVRHTGTLQQKRVALQRSAGRGIVLTERPVDLPLRLDLTGGGLDRRMLIAASSARS